MRIVIYGPERRVGALDAGRVIDLERASEGRVPPRLDALIEAGSPGTEAARRALERFAAADTDGVVVHDAKAVKLHAPWPRRRIACAGGNFARHLQGMWADRPGMTDLDAIARAAREAGQWGFWKVPDEVAGPDDDIPLPKRTRYFDYEGELAIVLGKRGKDIPAERADEHVWGVTLLHDWSIRDARPGPVPLISYNLAKNFDGSTSLGPCIVVAELDHRDVEVETRVNGEVRQRFSTKEMIFAFAEILEFLSRDLSLVPGDVVAGGTSAGTAADTTRAGPDGTKPLDRFLKVGDVVEVSSPKIGTLRNRIV